MTYTSPPTMPAPITFLDMKVELHGSPTIQDVFKGFEKIRVKYPDASMNEVRIESYEDGSFESDLHTEYCLSFHRCMRDPTYEKKVRAYEKAMEVWYKQEHEAQMQDLAIDRLAAEQRDAKFEYKKASHEVRKRAYEQTKVNSQLALANAILGIEEK